MLRRSSIALATIALFAALAPVSFAQVDTQSLAGKPAPDFSLPALDGKTNRLWDQKGKVVMLEFWRISTAKAIPPLLPFVQQLSADKKLAADGLVVWSITAPIQQTQDQVAQFLKDKRYTFPALFDAQFKVFKKYLDHTLPTTVIVGPDGTVLFAYAGWDADDPEHLKRLIVNAIDRGLHGYNGADIDLLGELVPAITITTFAGKKFDLADLKGKVILLDVWAEWCPHCKVELPFIQKLAGDPALAKRGLVVITLAANLDETETAAHKAYIDRKYTFPAGFDTTGAAGDKLGLIGVPSLFLIGRDGTVHNFFAGFDITEGPMAGQDISKDIDRAMNAALDEAGGK